MNTDLFPQIKYPNNTSQNYKDSDDCCMRNCYPENKCGHNIEGIHKIHEHWFSLKKPSNILQKEQYSFSVAGNTLKSTED